MYLINAPQTQIQSWYSIPEKRHFKYIVMHHNYQNYTLEVAQEAIFS